MFGHAPDISDLVPFYAPGEFHTTDTQTGAGTSYKYKAEACRVLGYSEVSKNTYVVLLVNSNYIAERTDCHFNEDLYEKIRSVKNLPNKELEDVIQFLHDDEQFEHDLERLIDLALADDKATQTDFVPAPPAPVTISSNHVPTITAPPANTDIPAATDSIPKIRPRSPFALAPHTRGDSRIAAATDALNGEDHSDDEGDTSVESLNEDLAAFECLLASSTPYGREGPNDHEVEQCLYDDWCNDLVCAAIPDLPPLPPSPKTVSAALNGPDADLWEEAILKELTSLGEAGTFDYDVEQKGRGMNMKWVLKVMWDNDFKLKYKARLVCCG